MRHPTGMGGRGRVDVGLHYQFGWAATLLEMLGQTVPESWDGRSFFKAFREGQTEGRDFLVTSNCAWACQRGVRWGEYLLLRTCHSGFKNYPERLLFNVAADPLHACFDSPAFEQYVERLRKTGRDSFADELIQRKRDLR